MERNIRILKAIYALFGFMPASALWIIYFSRLTHSVKAGALVFIVIFAAAAVFDLPSGVFSDRVGRRAALLVGSISLAIAMTLYALANGTVVLVAAGIFDGIGIAMFFGTTQALLHESLNELGRGDEFAKQYGRVMGLEQWTVCGAAVIGAVLASVSLRWAVYASVPSFYGCVMLAWFIEEPTRHTEHVDSPFAHMKAAVRVIARNRRLTMLALATMLSAGVGNALFTLRPIWIQSLWPIWAVSLARSLSALLSAIGAWWGGAIVGRLGALKAIVVTQLSSSVADIAAIAVANAVSPAVLQWASFTYGVGMTANGTLLQDEFTDEQRATLGSLVSVGGRIVYGITLVFFSVVLAGDLSTALIVGELMLILAVAMYAGAFRVPAYIVKLERQEYVPG